MCCLWQVCIGILSTRTVKLGQKLCKKDGTEVAYRSMNYRISWYGDEDKYDEITVIITVSTVMRQVLRHVRQPVRHTGRYRDISAKQKKVSIRKHWR